jgi:hypothetical protein
LDPCILSSFDFLASHPADSPESLNTPPSKKPSAPALTVATGIDLNISVPAVLEQFAENPSASTAMDLPPKVNAKVDSSVKESNPFMPDLEIGELNHCFDSKFCKIPANEEMVALNSRVVVFNNDVQHVMHSGQAEFYLMDDLHQCPHLFENGSELPSPQTRPLVTIQYLIGVDFFSDDLSIARTGGKVFHTFFGDA